MRAATVMLLVFVLVGLVQPLAMPLVAVAEEPPFTPPPENINATRIVVRAVLVQNIIERLLATVDAERVPGDLLARMQQLAAVNLSSLTPEELVEYVREARQVIQEFKSYVVSEGLLPARDLMRAVMLERLKALVEARLERLAPRLNITGEELERLVAEIRGASSFQELVEIVKSVDSRLAVGLTVAFAKRARHMMDEAMMELVKARLRGDLDRAVKASWKVLAVLNRTLERLRELNVSQNAIEALEKAIQHIMVSRSILADVAREIGPAVKQPPEKMEEALRKMQGVVAERIRERTLAGIEAMMRELQMYREILVSITTKTVNVTVNVTVSIERLVSEIDALLQKLADVKKRIEAGDLQAALAAVNTIVEARKTLAKARMVVAKTAVQAGEEKELAEALYHKVTARLEEAKRRLAAVEEKVGKVSDPRAKMRAQTLLERAKAALATIEDLVAQASTAIENGDYTQALRLLQKAAGMLSALERLIAQLERITS